MRPLEDLHNRNWLRGLDLNQRPSGYEPDKLPDCSTPRHNIIIYFVIINCNLFIIILNKLKAKQSYSNKLISRNIVFYL